MRFTFEASYNFNKHGLRGADFNVLPFLCLFPPQRWGGYAGTRGWTAHFGWLWWTCIIHQHTRERYMPEEKPQHGLTLDDMNAHARDC